MHHILQYQYIYASGSFYNASWLFTTCDFFRCKSRFSCVSAAFQLRFSSLEVFLFETFFWSQNIRVLLVKLLFVCFNCVLAGKNGVLTLCPKSRRQPKHQTCTKLDVRTYLTSLSMVSILTWWEDWFVNFFPLGTDGITCIRSSSGIPINSTPVPL